MEESYSSRGGAADTKGGADFRKSSQEVRKEKGHQQESPTLGSSTQLLQARPVTEADGGWKMGMPMAWVPLECKLKAWAAIEKKLV